MTFALSPQTKRNDWEKEHIFVYFVMTEEEPFPNLLPEEPIPSEATLGMEQIFLMRFKMLMVA